MNLLRELITVGITSHNSSETISRAIQSVQKQDWPHFEIVVVDDASNDGTVEVVNSLMIEDQRIRLFEHSSNRGVAATRNTIIDNAKGAFIAFLDDDDEALPTRLQSQYTRLIDYEGRTSAAMIFCYSHRFVAAGKNSPHLSASAIGDRAPEPWGTAVADFLLGLPPSDIKAAWGLMGCGTMMARRSTFQRVGLFDPDFRRFEEQDMAIRAAQMGAHFISVDRPLITQYKTQSEEKSGMKPLHYALMLRDKHRDYLDQRGLYHASRMFARSNFWGNKKHRLKSRFYRALGYALAPQLIPAYLKRRSGGAE